MADEQTSGADVICDLRQLDSASLDISGVQDLWRRISGSLVGQPLVPGSFIKVALPNGELALWVLSATGGVVGSDTAFNIVDVMRSPKLLYQCRDCGKYGPLRCIGCEDEGRPARLCAKCAHQIRDELTAYCQVHAPVCGCRPECDQRATFRCQRRDIGGQRKICRRLFGDHYLRRKPFDPDVEYCKRCFSNLFEQCVECQREGRRKAALGKIKCAYRTRVGTPPCGKPLCYGHSYQWKIWGKYYRGINLCDEHQRALGGSVPGDLLYLILSAPPPFERRGKRRSLPNPFQLQRIVNHKRATKLSLEHIGHALAALSDQAKSWGNAAQRNYDYLSGRLNEVLRLQAELLPRAIAFYRDELGAEAATQIVGLTVNDYIFKTRRHRVTLHLATSNKGLFIGAGGVRINRLKLQLGVEVDV